MSNAFLYILIVLTSTRLAYQWEAKQLGTRPAIRKALWEIFLLLPIMNLWSGFFLLLLIFLINAISVFWEARTRDIEWSRFVVFTGILLSLFLAEGLIDKEAPTLLSSLLSGWKKEPRFISWKIFTPDFLSMVAGLLILTNEINHLIRFILHRLKVEPKESRSVSVPSDTAYPFEGLSRGRIIGVLERAMIFLVVLSNQLSAIGFILTAKGVARFKNLDEKDFVEYLIIGTFLSALMALLVGLVFKGMYFPEWGAK